MNPACTPNGANASFVPGERSHFQVVASTATVSRMRPWRCLSFPFNLIFMVLPSFAVLPRWRADRGGRPVLPPQRQIKNPAEGGNHAAGCCGPEAEARVTFHWADLRDPFIKGGGRRCALRLWNPEIA